MHPLPTSSPPSEVLETPFARAAAGQAPAEPKPGKTKIPHRRRTNADISSETRARILEATAASLAELGYAGTTMSGIAERIGVSRAALIYHFNSKNALMAAVIDAIYDEMAAMYRSAAHPALLPAERMLAVLDASFQFTHTVSQMAHIELLLAARRDASFRDEVAPAIALRDRGFEEAWHALTAELDGSRERLDLVRDFALSQRVCPKLTKILTFKKVCIQ